LKVEVTGVDGTWWDAIPGVSLVEELSSGAVLQLAEGVDEQRVLDLARGAGDVTHFSRVRPSLTELFREAVPT